MFVAFAQADGVIGFSHHATAPNGVMVFAQGEDLAALKAVVEVRSRHAYDHVTYVVPGVPEADDVDEALEALEKWAGWAFPNAEPVYQVVGNDDFDLARA